MKSKHELVPVSTPPLTLAREREMPLPLRIELKGVCFVYQAGLLNKAFRNLLANMSNDLDANRVAVVELLLQLYVDVSSQ